MTGTLPSALQAQACTWGWTGDSGSENGKSQRRLDTILHGKLLKKLKKSLRSGCWVTLSLKAFAMPLPQEPWQLQASV